MSHAHISLLVVVLAIGCGQCSRADRGHLAGQRTNPVLAASAELNPSSLGGKQCLPTSFADLAAAADQAVVQVRTRQRRPSRSGRRQVTGEGLGSAFVYDPSGRLLTNFHVVADATEIFVAFKDGRELPAKVIGADPPTDVAVLQVGESGLPALALGASEQLRVGDWVLAIGNPFGLSHTVSAGIVSAKGRTMTELEGVDTGAAYASFLQTDASINPGNSGGPMLDLSGKVVGISTAIRAHSNNIGFAIPTEIVSALLPALVGFGRVRRAALGISVELPSPQELRAMPSPGIRGAVVRAIQLAGPADRAGMHVGDVVIEFDGHPVETPERLQWLASMAGIGHVADVTVLRQAKRVQFKAKLTELQVTREGDSDLEAD